MKDNKRLGIPTLFHEQCLHGHTALRGIAELRRIHHVAGSNEAAAKIALESVVDIDLPFADAYPSLISQMKEGKSAKALMYRHDRDSVGRTRSSFECSARRCRKMRTHSCLSLSFDR
jgi:hypothetical protein